MEETKKIHFIFDANIDLEWFQNLLLPHYPKITTSETYLSVFDDDKIKKFKEGKEGYEVIIVGAPSVLIGRTRALGIDDIKFIADNDYLKLVKESGIFMTEKQLFEELSKKLTWDKLVRSTFGYNFLVDRIRIAKFN